MKKTSVGVYSYRPQWMQAFEARSIAEQVPENYIRGRNAFNRDLGVIVHSNYFKRLSHKTQVYSLPYNDHVHTRLTHSIEASQIGRQIARFFNMQISKKLLSGEDFYKFSSELEELTSAACLAHDIGHSPFGHTGHGVIADFCDDKKEIHQFDDNKQVVRILLNGHWFEKIKTSGPFVASILKKNNTKDNCYKSELKQLLKITNQLKLTNLRHPASVFMEAADDIAYLSADILDFMAIYSNEKTLAGKKILKLLAKLHCIDSKGKEGNTTLDFYFNKAINNGTGDAIQDFSDAFMKIALNHVFDSIIEFNNVFMSSKKPSLEELPKHLTAFVSQQLKTVKIRN